MSTADQTPSMPPLPEGDMGDYYGNEGFTAAQMHAYAQAVADERVRALESELSGLRAARMAYASEFPPNADGEPDVGSIHANIREMKRKAARYDWLRNEAWGGAYQRGTTPHVVLYRAGLAPGAVLELAEEALDDAIDAEISTLSLAGSKAPP